MANEFIARKGLIALNDSSITGSLGISGSLTVESSGSTVFEVVGSTGQLFSIDDNMQGSLFAVSDISGLPILEVFSDDKVVAGGYGQNAFVVTGSKVGIGTSTPESTFTVSGTSSFHGPVYLNNADSNQGKADFAVKISTASDGSAGSQPAISLLSTQVNLGGNDMNYVARWDISNNDTTLRAWERNIKIMTQGNSGGRHIILSTTGSERMRITKEGNVGIGTTSPSEMLEVSGNIKAHNFVGTSSLATTASFATTAAFALNVPENTGFPFTGSAAISGNLDIFDVTATNNPRVRIGRGTAQNISFSVTDNINTITANQDSDSNGNHSFVLNRDFQGTGSNDFIIQKGGANQLKIASNGNVSIGTTNSASKFNVGGTVSSSKIDVRGTAKNILMSSHNDGVVEIKPSNTGSGGPRPVILYRDKPQGNALYMLADNQTTRFGLYDGGLAALDGQGGAPTASFNMVSITPGNLSSTFKSPRINIGAAGSTNARLIIGDTIQFSNTGSVNSYINVPEGKFGIGTTSPNYKLHVNGNTRVNALYAADSIIHEGDTDNTIAFGTDTQTFSVNGNPNINIYNGGVVVNENGLDRDFRIESNNNENLFFVNGGTDRIGFGTLSPDAKYNMVGDAGATIGFNDLTSSILLLGSSTSGIGIDSNEIAKAGGSLYFGTLGTGDHNIFFRTNGANNRMYISASGRVGINTVTPDEILHVDGNIKGTDIIADDEVITSTITTPSADPDLLLKPDGAGHVYLGNSGNGNNLYHYSQANDGKYTTFTHSGTKYKILPNATDGLELASDTQVSGRLYATGNITSSNYYASNRIGIGTSSPTSPLHIFESSSGTSTSTGITIEQTGSGDSLLQFLLSNQRRFVMGIDNNDSDKFKISKTFNLDTSASFVIDGNQAGPNSKIGINTVNPLRALHVSGSGSDAGILLERSTNDAIIETKTQQAGAYFKATDNSAGSNSYYGLELAKGSTTNWFLGSYGYKDFRIVSGAKSTGTSSLTIKHDGDVGIGTDSPDAKLTVSGNLSVKGDITASGAISADILTLVGTSIIENETLVISGNNVFGEDNSNTHEFNGSITASGDISASGIIHGTSFKIGAATVLQGETDITLGSAGATGTISLTTHGGTPLKINDSDDVEIAGNISASGTMTLGSSSLSGSIFEVIGSSGQLFSVDDGMSGSLFAVSDISGLPILEVFSDDTIKLGSFNNEALIISGSQISSSLDIIGNITASGITASGDITANQFNIEDTNAAIYRNSNDLELITYAGYDINLMPSNKVGIGTRSPERKLHVLENGEIVSALFKGESSAGHLIDLEQSASATDTPSYNGFRFYNGDNFRMALTHVQTGTRGYTQIGNAWHTGSEILVVDGDNNRVGIGTTTPPETLTVIGGISSSNDITTQGSIQIKNFEEGIKFFSGSGYEGNKIRLTSAGNMQFIANGKFQFYDPIEVLRGKAIEFRNAEHLGSDILIFNSGSTTSSARLNFDHGSTNLMVISSSGNVGIGQTSPTEALELGSGKKIKLRSSTNPTGSIVFRANDSQTLFSSFNTSAGDDQQFVIKHNDHEAELINRRGDLILSASTGRIGVGTNIPSHSLHVRPNTGNGESMVEDSTGTVAVFTQAQPTLGRFGTKTNHNLQLIANDSAGITIKNNGKVGIGTTNPAQLLEVNGGNIKVNGGNLQISHSSAGQIGGQFEQPNQDLLTFRFDSKRFRFWAGGTERLTILSSSGNVGIGTSSPSTPLQISNAGSFTPFRVTNTTNSTQFDILALTDNLTIGSSTNHPLNLMSNNSTGITLATNGNVGIGTTSPSNNLEVADSANPKIRLTDNAGGFSLIEGNGGNLDFRADEGNTQGSSRMAFKIDGTEKMRIDSQGRVGIGTTSPETKLQVNFETTHTTEDISFTHASIDLYNPLEQNLDEKGSILTFSDNYSSSGGYNRTVRAAIKGGTDTIGNTANGFLAFYTDEINANSAKERMRIDSLGNVGIRTTSPSDQLEVSGTIRQTGPEHNLRIQHGSDVIGSNNVVVQAQNSYLQLKSNTNHVLIDTGDAIRFRKSSDSSEHARITSDGKFGVGTSSPQQSITTTGNLLVTASATRKIEVSVNDYNGKAQIRLNSLRSGSNSQDEPLGMGSSTLFKSGGLTYFDTDEDFIIRPNNDEAFRVRGQGDIQFISSSGNGDTIYFVGDASEQRIGIGTTTPAYGLHVNDDMGISSKLYHADDNDTFINFSQNDKINFEAGGTENLVLNGDDTIFNANYNNIDFVARGSESIDNALFIKATTGNVGIGTGSPTSKLHVSGTLTTTDSVTISGSLIVTDRITELSAERFKENIQPLTNSLEKTIQLEGVSFNKIGKTETEIGFIAEQVAQIYPEFIEYDSSGKEVVGIQYSRITAALLESIKELNTRITSQQIFIDSLAARIEKLENK